MTISNKKQIRKVSSGIPLPSGVVVDSLASDSTTNAPSVKVVKDLKDKLIKITNDTVTFDGDFENAEIIPVYQDAEGMYGLVKVSDVVPTWDDFAGGASYVYTAVQNGMVVYSESILSPQEYIMLDEATGLIGEWLLSFAIIPTDNFNLNLDMSFANMPVFNAVIPKKGTYLLLIASADFSYIQYISSLTIPGYTGFPLTEELIVGHHVHNEYASYSHGHDLETDVNGLLEVRFGGTGYNSITDTKYTTARYRASSLHSSETTPTKNGVIAWTYE